MTEKTYSKFLKELILLYLGENDNISEFKLYAFMFLISFPLEEEFNRYSIDVEEFRKDMLKKMEELLKER